MSYKVCEALEESKNNGDKLLGSISAFVVQAAISAGIIFFIIKANEIVFNKGRVELYQTLAGINAIISGIACVVFLGFIISASYERYQNGKVAREYANLVMEKLRYIDENSSDNISSPGTEDITSKPSASPHPPGFINDLTQEVTSMPSSTEEEKPKPSAPPYPPGFINESISLHSVTNMEGHHGGMMPGNPT